MSAYAELHKHVKATFTGNPTQLSHKRAIPPLKLFPYVLFPTFQSTSCGKPFRTFQVLHEMSCLSRECLCVRFKVLPMYSKVKESKMGDESGREFQEVCIT
jgi:hypothetical protein